MFTVSASTVKLKNNEVTPCYGREHQKRDRAFVIDGRPLPHPSNRRVRHVRTDQRQIEHNAAVQSTRRRVAVPQGEGKQRQRNRGAEDQAEMQVPESSEQLQLGWPLPTRSSTDKFGLVQTRFL